jgi:hypothetical protein
MSKDGRMVFVLSIPEKSPIFKLFPTDFHIKMYFCTLQIENKKAS